MAKVRVASVGEIPEGTLKPVLVDHTEICLAHAEDGNFYAINDVCTHENFLLSGGELFELQVECPQHGSRFNLFLQSEGSPVARSGRISRSSKRASPTSTLPTPHSAHAR